MTLVVVQEVFLGPLLGFGRCGFAEPQCIPHRENGSEMSSINFSQCERKFFSDSRPSVPSFRKASTSRSACLPFGLPVDNNSQNTDLARWCADESRVCRRLLQLPLSGRVYQVGASSKSTVMVHCQWLTNFARERSNLGCL